ncbi:hypothetical protein BS50DRAFT_141639 [Corynespora cassiicola Philippines]|uniref:Chitin-binding type-4 domain-containing protein n=1 Tax=Corynespora cassiicola Philippines TaxID=1448308 RepID=A0A2T2NA20_CORCC|nr:hypothetical protein BS50DRAFT_141639 [Corynespora cassiicola Philippines]
MKSYTAALGLAGLVSSVAGHGYIVSPAPRMPGDAMSASCGQQMFNNQNSDHYGNVQGQLQVTNGQADYDAAACNVWLCKGYQFDDNTANVQEFTAGQTVAMEVEIRAPHTGTANVSIVKTSSNSVIGTPLISWDEYASNSAPIPEEQTKFDITIPADIGSECATAGDCVIQWFWDARSIDQTYEGCIDFTVGGSGSGSPAPSASAPAATTPAPSAPAVSSTPAPTSAAAEDAPAPAPTASSAPSPVPSQGANNSLPETFTLEQFITWLKETTSLSATAKRALVARIHARAFNM